MGRLKKKRKSGPKKKKQSTGKPSAQSSSSSIDSKGISSSDASAKGPKRQAAMPAKRQKSKPVSKSGKRKNYIDIAAQFLREVVMELKKVTWPSRKQTTGSTVVMLILVAIISMFLGTVDIGLSKLVQIVLQ